MPELPEVQTVATELNRKLKGLTIGRVLVRTPKMVSVGPQTVSNVRKAGRAKAVRFAAMLEGQKILSVSRRAKLLLFDLSGPLSFFAHLKMTGQFIYEDKKLRAKTRGEYRLFNRLSAPRENLPSRHTHVIFKFTDGSTLYFNDVRKFGYLKAVLDSELERVKELQVFGPEPLHKSFTFSKFGEILHRRPKGRIKQLLMDASLIAGIGNIYSDEILFHAKVRPDRSMGSLSDGEMGRIFRNIPLVLKKAIKAKGSSVGDFIRTDGSWGRMGKFHYVYGRKGQSCKVCGTPIQSLKIGGRTGSFCPRCQR